MLHRLLIIAILSSFVIHYSPTEILFPTALFFYRCYRIWFALFAYIYLVYLPSD